MLRDPLDEPEFYCVDVAGFGSNLNLNSPLQAHTCKPGADDELFIFNHPTPGQFYMGAYDCLPGGGRRLALRESVLGITKPTIRLERRRRNSFG